MQCPTVCELNPPRRRPREEMEDPTTYGSSSFGEHRNVRPLGFLSMGHGLTI